LTDAVVKLTDDQEIYDVFVNFCKTYKFIIHIHNKYKVNIHPGMSVKHNYVLGKTVETTARKFQKPFSEHVVFFSIDTNSVYYNFIRKQTKRKQMTPKEKYFHDMVFMDYCGKFTINLLTETSLLMRWFPNELQDHMELLCLEKPLDMDLGGLMTLMMFAGIGSQEHKYLKHQMCKDMFSEADSNLITDSHQNFAAFIFGITMDNISEMV
jgi:hypothetical protein